MGITLADEVAGVAQIGRAVTREYGIGIGKNVR